MSRNHTVRFYVHGRPPALTASSAAVQGLAETQAAAPAVQLESLTGEKKLPANIKTGIVLDYDLENKRVILPRELYLQNKTFFMNREQSFYRECMNAAFCMILLSPYEGI